MLSTVGLNLTGAIDPDLNWKTVSKRRARSSSTAGYKKKSRAGSLKERRRDLIDKDLKKVDDMSVSESKKLGVTILGQRLSETIGSVPIKKRKLLLVRSPSPPPHMPSPCLEESDCLLKSQLPLDREKVEQNLSVEVHNESALNSNEEQKVISISDTTNLEGINEKLGENADFSCISILATAACSSNMGCGSRNAEGSVGKEFSLADEGFLGIPQQIQPSSLSAEPWTGKDYQKDLGSFPDKSMETSLDLPNKENSILGRVESTSFRTDRSHWDLNTVMEEWESPCDVSTVEDGTRVGYGIHEGGMHEEKQGDLEHCQVQMELPHTDYPIESTVQLLDAQVASCDVDNDSSGFSDSKLQEQLTDGQLASCDVCIDSSGFANSKTREQHNFSCSSSVVNIVSSKSMDACVDDANVSEIPPGMDYLTSSTVSEENNDTPSVVDLVPHSVDQCMTDLQKDESNCLRSPMVKKNLLPLHTDSENTCTVDGSLGIVCQVLQVQLKPLDDVPCNAIDQSKGADMGSCHVETLASMFQGSSMCEELSTENTCASKGEKPVTGVNVQDGKVSDENENAIGMDFSVDIESKDSICNSANETPVMAEDYSLGGGMKSFDACKSGTNVSSGEVTLEDPCNSDYDSDVSANDLDHAIKEMDKASDLRADSDSQYEEGEFREPVMPSWEDNEGEEGDAEHIDYGSDDRDTDIFEAARDYDVHSDGDLVGQKDEQKTGFQPCVRGSLESDHSDIGSGKQDAIKGVGNISSGQFGGKDGHENLRVNVEVARELGAFDDEESSTAVRNRTGFHLSDAGKSLRRVSGSTPSKALPSLIEGPKYSVGSHRKDNVYVQGSRFDNLDDSSQRVERDGSVVHMHGRGRGVDHCFGVGPVRRVHKQYENASSQRLQRSLTARGSPKNKDGASDFGMQFGFRPLGKVGPDRSISIGRGRSGRYGPRIIGTGHRERNNGPVSDDSFDSSLTTQHHLARRERSFCPFPRRAALHPSRSCTKSRSRSRTRSPHMWPSPRGRSGDGMSGAPGLRRYSTSLNLRSEARMERVRSPPQRPDFAEHLLGFVSPPHAYQFREHVYKRSSISERSPPGRGFSRNPMSDLVDSPGRLNSDDYYKPKHSDRFLEFGVGRGPRHDGNDNDRRKHGDRYRMVHPMQHHDINSDVKRFKYDVEDGFTLHNTDAKKDLDFHGRRSPRDRRRGIAGRLGNAPRRAREEREYFRYGREEKDITNFNAFGIRECDEGGIPRRRRHSPS
ncbi:uncharacterized protein LOC143885280 isoform X2 [Tasmannia lanceolata]|uniref:uncharacterized protein LOC143885280 isoform X2 n=1 Tax=Tasmannia lanceolata TaxID=3420 RepID=UPI004062D631